MSSTRCLNAMCRALLPIRPTNRSVSTSYNLAASFHDTAPLAKRKRILRDGNKMRGVSAIHRKYPKEDLSIKNIPLPKPAIEPKDRTEVTIDQDHGLYGFFMKGGKPLPTPEEDHNHGRAWTVEELRRKSWEDLQKLWERLDPGYGEYEAVERERDILRTQRAIKHALTERYYAWQEARELAKNDPEIDMTGEGPAFTPMALEDDIPSDTLEAPNTSPAT